MSTHRWINKICAAAIVLSLLLTIVLMNGESLGILAVQKEAGYESRLFDTSRVHTVDIVMDDWDSFLENCENEEYSACAVVIDGESIRNVGLRAKGNTSLSTVRQKGSNRYSLKIEFDHYQTGNTFHGLDKLCLNNLIQDNTMMKDYLAYRMMGDFGVDAPLCSYVWVTVNGADWGLYLAVEGLEDAFLQREYGSNTGDLYKPDSMNFGGGRGNGRDFKMSEFDFSQFGPRRPGADTGTDSGGVNGNAATGSSDRRFPGFPMGGVGSSDGQFPGFPMGGFDSSDRRSGKLGGGRPGGGMGSNDVKLIYTDDDPGSYSNIFNSAKTDVTDADRARLIAALKTIRDALENPGEESGLEKVLDVDEVLRYFVVHNFVVNGDSYTGSMIHNYYLHEKDGKLSMIPWDYNLAYGNFQGNDANSAVNDPVDTPLSVNGDGDRPMADWILSSEEYTVMYHQYFAEFLSSLDLDAMISETTAMLDEYVQRDPSKFCTYEQFQTGVEILKQFCQLRVESVWGQLSGTIPSTKEGQEADSSSLVAASGLMLSDMGSMRGGGGIGGGESGGGPGGESGSGRTGRGGGFPGGGFQGDEFPGGGFQGGEFPGGGFLGGGFPVSGFQDSGFPGGGFPVGDSGQNALTAETWILLGASAAVLFCGVLFARKWRRF